MKKGAHLTHEGLDKIRLIKAGMNPVKGKENKFDWFIG
jgi:hypothetical protein